MFFSVYFFIIFSLLGVQLIGAVNGICMLNGTNDTNIGESSFTIPLLHCNLIDTNNGYKCPLGFVCTDQTQFSISDGNLYFGNLFDGIMFVYQGTIADSWSSHAWLVRNIFVAVITQVLSEALEYDPPVKEYDLKNSNFGLTLSINEEKTVLKDQAENKKLDGNFNLFLKFILSSVIWNIFISALLITDTALLATIGMLYSWQTFLAALFFIEPLLRLIAYGYKTQSTMEWILYDFFIPTINIIAVILNYLDYYQLDVIYSIRLLRIISGHGIIFDFIKRILGNYARFASSLVLALSFLIVLSSLALQVFCGIPTQADPTVSVLPDFQTAFFDIFVIFLQGGAFSTMLSLGSLVSYGLHFFVVLFFVGIHFFSNTIMMSIFITFILANLELKEEEIMEMQKEITVSFEPLDQFSGGSIETTVVRLSDKITEDFIIPYRFKIYKKFKNSPPLAAIPEQLRKSNFPSVNKNFMALYLSEDYPVYDERLYVMENIKPDPDALTKYFIAKNFGFNDDEFDVKYDDSLNYESMIKFIKILNTKVSPLHTPTLFGKKNKIIIRPKTSTETGGESKHEKDLLILEKKISDLVQMRRRIITNLREQHPYIDKTLFIFGLDNTLRKYIGVDIDFTYNWLDNINDVRASG
ncbi:hypothetical protein HZS_2330 [Henneguya salminicola]|nr:hypothetical protein HZS_2330 [Henneguya salminicola]